MVDCYIDFRKELFEKTESFWRTRNFRDIVIASCLLASENPSLFGGENCDKNLPKLRRKKWKSKNINNKQSLNVANSTKESEKVFGASSEPILNYDNLPGLNIQKYPFSEKLQVERSPK